MIQIHEIITNNDGTNNIIINKQGQLIRLHSSRPIAESEKIFSQLSPSAPAYFLGGLGCGYLLEKLLKETSSPCVVFEPLSPIFDNVLSVRPQIQTLLNSPRVIFIRDLQTLTNIIQQQNFTDLVFNFNRSYQQIFPTEFQQIKEYINVGFRKKEIGNATLLRFGKLWTKNAFRNIHRYFTSRKLSSYQKWAYQKPAIIIGAGPSLGESLEYLKKHQDKAILIACDTALPMLYHENINPDFVVTVDPQEKNSLYLRYTPNKKHYLIADSSVHDSSFEGYQAQNIILTGSIFPLYKPFEHFWGEFGLLASGGSVSTSAFDFARQIQADPIFMVGQDLSFTQNKSHYCGNILTEFSRTRNNRLQSFHQQQALSMYPLHTKEVKGRKPYTKVLADARLTLFKDWFSQEIPKTESSVIVAGMEGAYLDGAKHLEIPQAFAMLKTPIDKQHPHHTYNKNIKDYQEFLDDISKQLAIILPNCKQLTSKISQAKQTNNLNLSMQYSTQLQELLSSKKNQHFSLFIAISLQGVIQEGLKSQDHLSTQEHISLLHRISKETTNALKQLQKQIAKSITIIK